MMMGVGNLTELTDVDSAGVNVMLAGFCQELGIRSVLTTEVINWCRSLRARARPGPAAGATTRSRDRCCRSALEPDLVLLRDPKLREHGDEALGELAAAITDRNYRLFAERGELHVINGGDAPATATDPFELFAG